MGYFGSMLLLVICLGIIMFIDPKYTSLSFLLVGVWWIGFSQITYRVLPNNVYQKKVEKGVVWRGFKELKIVFKQFRQTHRLKRFLLSFFFYNTGVQTVMLMAVIFAKKEVDWSEGGGDVGLIIAILLIQILGAQAKWLFLPFNKHVSFIAFSPKASAYKNEVLSSFTTPPHCRQIVAK